MSLRPAWRLGLDRPGGLLGAVGVGGHGGAGGQLRGGELEALEMPGLWGGLQKL